MKNKVQSLSVYLFIAVSFFLAIQLILMFINLFSGVLVAPDLSLAVG